MHTVYMGNFNPRGEADCWGEANSSFSLWVVDHGPIVAGI